MLTMHFVTSFLTGVLTLGLGSVEPEEEVWLGSLADGPEGIPITIQDYECRQSACGTPFRVISPVDGGLAGCTFNGNPTAPGCSGSCTVCVGGTATVNLCVTQEHADCIVGGGGGAVECGPAESNPCFYSTVLKLPVHCNCALIGGSEESDSCLVANCS